MKTFEIEQYENWIKREKKNADFNYETWEDIEGGFTSEVRQITYLWNHSFFEKISPLCEDFEFFYPYSFLIEEDCYYTFDLKKDWFTCRFCIVKEQEGNGNFLYRSSILFENAHDRFVPLSDYLSAFIPKIQPAMNDIIPIFEAIEKELLKDNDVRLRLLLNTLYVNKPWKEIIQDKGILLKNS